ncbi:MAG: glycosyltransferase family 2 protein [Deltaproteobacteria bacterium]|nr:glycosyltransferase family 2 protein [Deltaproteobacteria bacterium]
MPRVSIGLPVYNGENYLKDAVDSILNQTFEDFELIISDNASTDSTRDICEDYTQKDRRIRYFRNGINLGATLNYNRTYNLSNGKYFKWIAHDDLISPAYLEECVKSLDCNKDAVLSFPQITYIDETGRVLVSPPGGLSIRSANPAERLKQFVKFESKSNDIFWAIFGLIRSDVLRKTGLFGRYIANDQVLLTKILLAGPFYEVPEKMYFRRIHPNASTIKLPKISCFERARWYDTTDRPKLVLPNWKLLLEDLNAIRELDMDKQVKARCYLMIARMFANRWKRLALEMSSLPSQFIIRRTVKPF